MSPPQRRLLVVALPVVVLVLAGCQLRADVAVGVDGDGGGTLEVALAADDELRAAAAQVGTDPLDTLGTTVDELPDWEVRRPDDGSSERVTLVTTFADPEELARVSEEFADAVAAPELRPLEPFRLVVDDATVTLRGGAALAVMPLVRQLGVSPARARAVVADAVRLRIVASMPGDVLETNGELGPGGRTVTWTVDEGQRRDLLVIARRPWTLARLIDALATPAGLAAVIVPLLGAALLTTVVVRRRRRRAALALQALPSVPSSEE